MTSLRQPLCCFLYYFSLFYYILDDDSRSGNHSGRRTILAADPIQTGDQSNTGPCLLLHSLLIGSTLAAASFFDRNYCRSSLMFQSGDSFPFLLFLRKTTVGRSIDRTWDRLLHPFEHRSGLLLHPFEHGPGLLLYPFRTRRIS